MKPEMFELESDFSAMNPDFSGASVNALKPKTAAQLITLGVMILSPTRGLIGHGGGNVDTSSGLQPTPSATATPTTEFTPFAPFAPGSACFVETDKNICQEPYICKMPQKLSNGNQPVGSCELPQIEAPHSK